MQQTDPGGKLKRVLNCMPTRGLACLELAASLCPPTPFPTYAGQEEEQKLARMALRACKYKQGGCPAGWAVPHLFLCYGMAVPGAASLEGSPHPPAGI